MHSHETRTHTKTHTHNCVGSFSYQGAYIFSKTMLIFHNLNRYQKHNRNLNLQAIKCRLPYEKRLQVGFSRCLIAFLHHLRLRVPVLLCQYIRIRAFRGQKLTNIDTNLFTKETREATFALKSKDISYFREKCRQNDSTLIAMISWKNSRRNILFFVG